MITPSFGLTATERVLPRLALDFTTASLDPRVTFTRAGNTATRVNASGVVATVAADTPRFDFNPITLVCKGLLIEESRTNLFTYSSEFTNIAWTATQGTIAAATITNPDATTSGFLYTEDTATSLHAVGRSFSFTSGTSYSYSVWVKSNGRDVIEVGAGNTGTWGGRVRFNLALGTILASTGTGTITPFANGWYLCTVSGAAGATASTSVNVRGYSLAAASATYTGDGVSGFYLWGAQFEAGAFPTSYIPTVASQVTRNADIAVMTGANFSSWYNATEGTFVAQAIPSEVPATDAVSRFAVLVSGTDALRLERVSGNFRCVKTVSGSSSVSSTFAWTIGDTKWFGAAYKLNSNAAVFSAQAPSVLSGTLLSGMNALSFGTTTTGASNWWDGHIQKAMYFPQRLTDAELQAFTK
jgi:hypothetical protein